jgi:hypothetical protein
MKRRTLVGLILAGLTPALAAGAFSAEEDDDFGHSHDVLPPEQIVVPGATDQNLEELAREYAAALEEAKRRAAPSASEAPAANSFVPGIPANISEQVLELPFVLLGNEVDGDGDGVSNSDELRFKTNPNHPDTDGDGYIDGLEIVRGYNPLLASPGDKIDYTAVTVEQAPIDTALVITNVRLEQRGEKEVLAVTGTAPRDSIVTLLIFSATPRVAQLRSDESGRFRILLDDPLEEGSHRAYVTTTGAAGIVLATSTPYSFVRTDSGVLREIPSPIPQQETAAAAGSLAADGRLLAAAAAGVGLLVLAGGASALLFWRRSRQRPLRDRDTATKQHLPLG